MPKKRSNVIRKKQRIFLRKDILKKEIILKEKLLEKLLENLKNYLKKVVHH